MVGAVSVFLNNLSDKSGLSENTCISYGRDVELFFDYVSVLSDADIHCVATSDIQGYIEHMRDTGHADSTITRFAAAMRKFFSFAIDNPSYGVTENPMLSVKVPKVVRKLPQALSTDEVFTLLGTVRTNTPLGYRDKAMLELMYATGMSTSEIINVRVKDIDIKSGVMRCRNRKGERFVPLGKAAADAVNEYIKKARSALKAEPRENTLFLNHNGEPLTRQGFWKIVKGYIHEAGISDSVTPHTLRHSFAMHLLQNGADLRSISEMLGHTDIVSTKIYADALNNNLRKVYQKAHPRA